MKSPKTEKVVPKSFRRLSKVGKIHVFDKNFTKSLWVSPDALSLRPKGFNNSKFLNDNIIFLQLNGYSTLNVKMIFSEHLLFYISSSVLNLIFKFL